MTAQANFCLTDSRKLNCWGQDNAHEKKAVEMTWLLIVNPKAGGGKALRILPELRSRLRDLGMEAEIWISRYHRHAVKLAEGAILQGFSKIICVGGDGTLHEVAGAIVNSGKSDEVVLGLIPVGVGNDLCRHLGMKGDLANSLDVIRRGKIRKLDLGKMEDIYFVNSMGAGLDAVIARKAEQARFLPGSLRYLYAVFSSLLRLGSYRLEIEADGEKRKLNALMISIGNGSYCGRGFKLCPLAELDDGKLDLCIVQAIPLLRILASLPSVIKGNHLRFSYVTYRQPGSIRLSSEVDLPLYCDGELPKLKDKRQLRISIIPRKLNVICP